MACEVAVGSYLLLTGWTGAETASLRWGELWEVGVWRSFISPSLSGSFLILFLYLENGMQETPVISQGFQGLPWVEQVLL